MIYIDESLCTGCGTCVLECPQEALAIVGSVAMVDPARCTDCERCVPACPQGAIVGRTAATAKDNTKWPAQPVYSAQPAQAKLSTYPGPVNMSSDPSAGDVAAGPLPPYPAPARPLHAEVIPAGAAESPDPGPATQTRWQLAGKILSGLLALAGWALDRNLERANASSIVGWHRRRVRAGGSLQAGHLGVGKLEAGRLSTGRLGAGQPGAGQRGTGRQGARRLNIDRFVSGKRGQRCGQGAGQVTGRRIGRGAARGRGGRLV